MNDLEKKRQKQTLGPHNLMHSRVVLLEKERKEKRKRRILIEGRKNEFREPLHPL